MHTLFATHATRDVTDKVIEYLEKKKYGKEKNKNAWIRELRFWDASMYESMKDEFIRDLYRFSTVGKNRFSLRKIFRFLKWVMPIKEVDPSKYSTKLHNLPKIHLGAHHIYVIGTMEDHRNRHGQEEI